jgi:uncharacterized protein
VTGYFDTPAFVKLVVAAPGSAVARRAWLEASTVTSGRSLYVEARAGLAAASRQGSLGPAAHLAARTALEELWRRILEIGLTAGIGQAAADLAEQEALRASEAVHLATALDSGADVLVSADAALVAAARRRGLAVIDVRR